MKWDTIKFGDLYLEDSRNGLTKPSKVRGSGYKMINMGELFANDRIYDIPMELVPLKDSEKETAKVEKGDLLFARQSLVLEGAGKCCIVMDVSPLTVFESHIIRVRLDCSKANPLFYYYFFKSPLSPMSTIVSQCAQAGIRGNDLKELAVPLPPISIQNQIAIILTKYDQLIENSKRQINLLEEVARRLYKEWFVDFHFPGYEDVQVVDGIPNGWQEQSMEDIADYLNGYAFKPSDWGDKGKPIIKIKELNEGVSKDTPRNTGEDIPPKYEVFAGDIIFSWSATLTAKIWDEETGLLNQHLFKVTPHKGIAREYVLQSILKTLDEFGNLTTGSTMKHIQRGKLKQVFVKVPTGDLMKSYENYVDGIREHILMLNRKIILLREARNRLLPKLMSGEIEL